MTNDTRHKAVAIKTKARMGMIWEVQEHKAVCRSLLDLLAASHAEALSQVF
jgi:hypothetical protein